MGPILPLPVGKFSHMALIAVAPGGHDPAVDLRVKLEPVSVPTPFEGLVRARFGTREADGAFRQVERIVVPLEGDETFGETPEKRTRHSLRSH